MRAPESPLHHRIKRSSLPTPRQLAVLGALQFRDQQARRINRPLHFIMRNEIMLDLAKRSNLTRKDLRELRGVHPVLRQSRNLDRLLAAWHAGQQAPEEQHTTRVRRPRSAPNYKLRLKAMQQWRAELALEFDLEPYLLLDNDVLTWCANHPGQAPGLEVAGLVRRWQRQVVWQRFAEKFEITARCRTKPAGAGLYLNNTLIISTSRLWPDLYEMTRGPGGRLQSAPRRPTNRAWNDARLLPVIFPHVKVLAHSNIGVCRRSRCCYLYNPSFGCLQTACR